MGFLQSAAAFLIVISFYSACADFCDHQQHSEKTNQTTACCGSESTRIAPTWAAASEFDTDQETFTQIDQPPFGWANYNQLVIQSHLKATMPEVPGPWKCMCCKRIAKAKEEYCQKCWYHWQHVWDPSCVQGAPQQEQSESQPWNWKNEETSVPILADSEAHQKGDEARRRERSGCGGADFPSLPKFQPGKATTFSSAPSPFNRTIIRKPIDSNDSMAFTRKCKSHRSRCCAAGLGHSCQEAVARSCDNAFRCESRSRKMQHCDQKADHQGPASRNGQSRSRTASHFRTPTGQRQSWTCLDAPHRKSSRSLESTDYSLSNTTKRVCCRKQNTTSRRFSQRARPLSQSTTTRWVWSRTTNRTSRSTKGHQAKKDLVRMDLLLDPLAPSLSSELWQHKILSAERLVRAKATAKAPFWLECWGLWCSGMDPTLPSKLPNNFAPSPFYQWRRRLHSSIQSTTRCSFDPWWCFTWTTQHNDFSEFDKWCCSR